MHLDSKSFTKLAERGARRRCTFINDSEVIIFKYNIYRDRSRDKNAQISLRWNGNQNILPTFYLKSERKRRGRIHLLANFHRMIIHSNKIPCEELLQLRPRNA